MQRTCGCSELHQDDLIICRRRPQPAQSHQSACQTKQHTQVGTIWLSGQEFGGIQAICAVRRPGRAGALPALGCRRLCWHLKDIFAPLHLICCTTLLLSARIAPDIHFHAASVVIACNFGCRKNEGLRVCGPGGPCRCVFRRSRGDLRFQHRSAAGGECRAAMACAACRGPRPLIREPFA